MFDNSVLKKYLKIGFFLVSHEENNRDIFGRNSLPIKIIVFIYKYSNEYHIELTVYFVLK